MSLNERFLTVVKSELGDDPTMLMMLTMFEGNVLSIPESEFRETLEKYMKALQGVLNGE